MLSKLKKQSGLISKFEKKKNRKESYITKEGYTHKTKQKNTRGNSVVDSYKITVAIISPSAEIALDLCIGRLHTSKFRFIPVGRKS